MIVSDGTIARLTKRSTGLPGRPIRKEQAPALLRFVISAHCNCAQIPRHKRVVNDQESGTDTETLSKRRQPQQGTMRVLNNTNSTTSKSGDTTLLRNSTETLVFRVTFRSMTILPFDVTRSTFHAQHSHEPSAERIHYQEFLLKQRQRRRMKEQDEACYRQL